MTPQAPVAGPAPAPASGPAAGGIESALARVLQLGTYVSMAFVTIGTLGFIALGGSPMDPGPALDLAGLPADLLAGKPAAALWVGVIGILATPALRVLGALVGFARGGEWRMVAVAAGIIVVVGTGIVAGLLTG